MNGVLKDFKLEQKASEEVMNKYKNKIPEQVLDIWQNYGFGSFLNGYLKIVNPDDYEEVLKETYIQTEVEKIKNTTVLFATGMGDLIILEETEEEDRYMYIIKYRKGVFNNVLGGAYCFFRFLEDKEFISLELDIDMYNKAIQKYGEPAYDECFGYVPLLGLGGKDTVDNLKKVKLKEHIYIINDLVGPVEEME